MKTNRVKNYAKEILQKLFVKYYKRKDKYGEIKNGRRIMLKITELYKDYEHNNCDLKVKTAIDEATQKLKNCHYIKVDYLQYSDDVVKIYLNEDMLFEAENYMQHQYGIVARDYQVSQMKKLIATYQTKGALTGFYCDKLKAGISSTIMEIDIMKEQDILQMLQFIQNNRRNLYVREVSMLVFGTSKYFEEKCYENVCSIIREAIGQKALEHEQNDEILRRYHIGNVEQEIIIKGDCAVEMTSYTLQAKYFPAGIAVSAKDISKIRKININVERLITIENKTAFYRFNKREYITIYLGGYANRYQVAFLKKLAVDNPTMGYYHFGDIDAGGFLIHQHLCRETNIAFQLFGMGVEALQNPIYKNSLVKITEYDTKRLRGLKDVPLYREAVEMMLDKKIKLEQEIICLEIMESGNILATKNQ
jgi:DNA topoisomerase VI, subunit A